MTLSVVVITKNEETNIGRTLASVVNLADEVIVVDSGSTDRTLEIARSFGSKVKVFVEEWKGFARQKNSAIEKASGEWILSLDADEEVSAELAAEIRANLQPPDTRTIERYARRTDDIVEATQAYEEEHGRTIADTKNGMFFAFFVPRKNFFLGRWVRFGGFYPDRKLRLVRRDIARFEDRAVHEDIKVAGPAGALRNPLLHHAYPTLTSYIEHMDRYSSLGAQMAVEKDRSGFSLMDVVVRPVATFFYNYVLRRGFLDGREGLLLHLYHATYVSWKYAKVWELSRNRESSEVHS